MGGGRGVGFKDQGYCRVQGSGFRDRVQGFVWSFAYDLTVLYDRGALTLLRPGSVEQYVKILL